MHGLLINVIMIYTTLMCLLRRLELDFPVKFVPFILYRSNKWCSKCGMCMEKF